MKHLLDVNVLLAAIVKSHNQHAVAMAWLKEKQIVLCPIAELGFIRISTNKNIPGLGLKPGLGWRNLLPNEKRKESPMTCLLSQAIHKLQAR